jgi:hypothetical protein
MKKSLEVLASLIVAAACLSAPAVNAQAAAQSIDKPFIHPKWTGVWQANLDGVPAVILTLANDAGEANGTIVFHAIKKQDGHAFSFSTEPHTLIHPQMQDDTLSFQVVRGNGSAEVLNMSAQLRNDGSIAFTCSNCGPQGSKAELDRMQ